MALPINHVLARVGIASWASWLLIGSATFTYGQKSYPTTSYRGQTLLEKRQVYDVGSELYSESDVDFQAMSPNRWSMPPLGARPEVDRESGDFKSTTTANQNEKLERSTNLSSPSGNGNRMPTPSPAKNSYWAQAGIDFPLGLEGRIPTERRAEPKPKLTNGYPLPISAMPISVKQEVSEDSDSLSSNSPMLEAPASGRLKERLQNRNGQGRVLEVETSEAGGGYWDSFASGESSLDRGFRRSEITKRGPVEYPPLAGYRGSGYECDTGKSNTPTLEEIFRTGRYFGSANLSFLKPVLQGDIALDASGSAGQFQDNFEYDYSSASQFRFGFESQAGPGARVSYWEFDGASDTSNWTSADASLGETIVDLGGVLGGRQFSAVGLNDTVTVADALDVQSIEASFFKDIKFKVSRMGGRFGFQWVEVKRQTNAFLTDVSGSTVSWEGEDRFQGVGPTFGFDYFRPIGHTKIEFLATGDFGLIFGHRDKVVKDTSGFVFQNIGDDEFLTNLNLFMGAQYVISRGGNRSFYLRTGLDYQAWLGMNHTTASNSNLGLRGFSLTFGYNR